MAQSSNRDAFSFDDTTGRIDKTDGGVVVIDPTEVAGSDSGPGSDEPVRKRRGPKPGSKRTPKTASVSLDAKGIEGLLLSIHMMLAGLIKAPELVLSQPEAEAVAKAICNVQRHYPQVAATQQTLDWISLGLVLLTVYGTRAAAFQMRAKKQAAIKKTTPAPFTAFMEQANGQGLSPVA